MLSASPWRFQGCPERLWWCSFQLPTVCGNGPRPCWSSLPRLLRVQECSWFHWGIGAQCELLHKQLVASRRGDALLKKKVPVRIYFPQGQAQVTGLLSQLTSTFLVFGKRVMCQFENYTIAYYLNDSPRPAHCNCLLSFFLPVRLLSRISIVSPQPFSLKGEERKSSNALEKIKQRQKSQMLWNRKAHKRRRKHPRAVQEHLSVSPSSHQNA